MMDINEEMKKAKDAALKAEGNEMLKAVGAVNKSLLVGPDGKPVAQERKGPTKAELVAARTEMSEKVKALFRSDPMLADLGNVMSDLYQALIWVGQDIAAREGMTDDLAAHTARMCQEAVMSQPIVVEKLIDNLKQRVVPVLGRLKNHYAKLRRTQQAKVARVNKEILTKGLTVPMRASEAGLKSLKIGESIILRGEPAAVRAALKEFITAHASADKGHACLLTSEEGLKGVPGIVMPVAWWKNCAEDIGTLDNVLQSAVDSAVTLLAIDDISLAASGHGKAVARLHSWCVNGLAAGVFGEPSTGGEVTFEGPFHRFLVTADISGVLTYSAVNLKGERA